MRKNKKIITRVDERIEKMLDERGVHIIGLDDTFCFHCMQCGRCCVRREDIILSPLDIFKMAKELQMDCDRFIEKYCEKYMGTDSKFPIIRLLPVGPLSVCPLLQYGKCTVHSVKPTVCAMYPLGRIMDDEKRVQYIVQQGNCGDNSETHTVREWLTKFNIPIEDHFFVEMSEVKISVSRILQKIEKESNTIVCMQVSFLIGEILYLGYRMEEDFMPQFKRKIERIMEVVGEV